MLMKAGRGVRRVCLKLTDGDVAPPASALPLSVFVDDVESGWPLSRHRSTASAGFGAEVARIVGVRGDQETVGRTQQHVGTSPNLHLTLPAMM